MRPHRKTCRGAAGSHSGRLSPSTVMAANCGQPTMATTSGAWPREEETKTSKAPSCKGRKSAWESSGATSSSSVGTTSLHAWPGAAAKACTSCSADNFSGAMLVRSVACMKPTKSPSLATASAPSSLPNESRARSSHARLRMASLSFSINGAAPSSFCVSLSSAPAAPAAIAVLWQSL